MTTGQPVTPPRRKWHLRRWLALIAVAVVAYFGWKAYDFRAAMKEAEALGWEVDYADPLETIRKDWRAAFAQKTWQDAVPEVDIPSGDQLQKHRKLVHRLNPKTLAIRDTTALRDLSALDGLTRIERVFIYNTRNLASLDTLKTLPVLRFVLFHDCTGLTNVDALKSIPALKEVWITGATGLTRETVAVLSAALPKAEVIGF